MVTVVSESDKILLLLVDKLNTSGEFGEFEFKSPSDHDDSLVKGFMQSDRLSFEFIIYYFPVSASYGVYLNVYYHYGKFESTKIFSSSQQSFVCGETAVRVIVAEFDTYILELATYLQESILSMKGD